MIIGVIILILIAVSVCMVKAENKRFRITEYEYYTDKIDKPVKLAVLTDLHNYSYGEGNEELLRVIDEVTPDYCISAGDMIESGRYATDPVETVRFLSRLAAKHKFVYGIGNHEMRLLEKNTVYADTAQKYLDTLQEVKNVTPLDNEVLELAGENIKIYGLSLENDYFKKVILNKVSSEHIEKLVGKPDDKTLNILIGHNPDQFDAYAQWGADVVLAGHIHGGMIATPWHQGLISPRFIPFPKYDWGVYKKDNTTMFLGRGLGNHTIHIRIFNRAELMVIRLLPGEKG